MPYCIGLKTGLFDTGSGIAVILPEEVGLIVSVWAKKRKRWQHHQNIPVSRVMVCDVMRPGDQIPLVGASRARLLKVVLDSLFKRTLEVKGDTMLIRIIRTKIKF